MVNPYLGLLQDGLGRRVGERADEPHLLRGHGAICCRHRGQRGRDRGDSLVAAAARVGIAHGGCGGGRGDGGGGRHVLADEVEPLPVDKIGIRDESTRV